MKRKQVTRSRQEKLNYKPLDTKLSSTDLSVIMPNRLIINQLAVSRTISRLPPPRQYNMPYRQPKYNLVERLLLHMYRGCPSRF